MSDAPLEIQTEEKSSCYLCASRGKVLYEHLEDRLFGTFGSWTLKQCTGARCGLIWLDPMPTKEEIGKAYLNYYTHPHFKYTSRTLLSKVVRLIQRPLYNVLLGLSDELKLSFPRNFIFQEVGINSTATGKITGAVYVD